MFSKTKFKMFNKTTLLLSIVDCGEISSATVLAHLYNNSKSFGMKKNQYIANTMTEKEAIQLLKKNKYFDYLHGRPLYVSFIDFPKLETQLYDREQGGDGTVERLINELKNTDKLSTELPSVDLSEGLDVWNDEGGKNHL